MIGQRKRSKVGRKEGRKEEEVKGMKVKGMNRAEIGNDSINQIRW